MQEDEQGRDAPADESRDDRGDAEESLALGPFLMAVGGCADLLARIGERVDGHLGVPPGGVTWGHVADANRLLRELGNAAFVAGAGGEPPA